MEFARGAHAFLPDPKHRCVKHLAELKTRGCRREIASSTAIPCYRGDENLMVDPLDDVR